jgi:hypothetical protein
MASSRAVLTLLAAVAMAVPPPASAQAPARPSGRWQWPVRGRVTERFRVARDRFARGQHRGIDVEAAPGTRVRSACPGRVSFVGVVPGGGRTVSVRCGDLTATYQRLGTTAARRGTAVGQGTPLGAVGSADLHFGVHHSADRHAYVDPLSLLGAGRPKASPPLAPLVRAPRGRPLGAPPAPRADVPRPLARRSPVAARREGVPGGVPLAARVGAALAVLGLPGWGVRRRRRRRRLRHSSAVARHAAVPRTAR